VDVVTEEVQEVMFLTVGIIQEAIIVQGEKVEHIHGLE